MNSDLLQIHEYLRDREGLRIDLRGAGRSEFLYVRSPDRAAEISRAEGGFFVEFWDNADEESHEPVRSEIVESASVVKNRLTEWL